MRVNEPITNHAAPVPDGEPLVSRTDPGGRIVFANHVFVEVSGYTELVNRTRRDARNELMLDVSRVCGSGVVVKRTELRISDQECKGVGTGQFAGHDHRAEVTMIGTAITQFSRDRRASQRPSVAVLSLDPERRLAARTAFLRSENDDQPHPPSAGQRDNLEDANFASEEQQ